MFEYTLMQLLKGSWKDFPIILVVCNGYSWHVFASLLWCWGGSICLSLKHVPQNIQYTVTVAYLNETYKNISIVATILLPEVEKICDTWESDIRQCLLYYPSKLHYRIKRAIILRLAINVVYSKIIFGWCTQIEWELRCRWKVCYIFCHLITDTNTRSANSSPFAVLGFGAIKQVTSAK